MATIEIHNGKGGVDRRLINDDKPILFGTSEECDIVLPGPGVFPIHGRIRWKSKQMKAQASPAAGRLEVNGKLVEAKSLHTGDEIKVGGCKIFLINADEGGVAEDGKGKRAPAAKSFEEKAWEAALDLGKPAKPAERAPDADPRPMLKRGRGSLQPVDEQYERMLKEAQVRKAERAVAKAEEKGHRHGALGWLLKAIAAKDQKPGEERIITSPLVLGLVGTLVALVVLGTSLYTLMQRSAANRAYRVAVDSYDHGEYRTSIQRYDDFVTGFPKDKRVSEARVFRQLANVRQFTSTTGPSWTNGVRAAREMVRAVRKETKYRDVKIELAELVLKAAEGLADRTKRTAGAADLAEAEDALELHNQIAGQAADLMVKKSNYLSKIAEARATVRKASYRTRALAEMEAGLKGESSAAVYAARDKLLESYPDLAVDREIVGRLTKANNLIRGAVTLDETTRAAYSKPADDPLGPAFSLSFRAGPDAANAPLSGDPIVYATSEGFAYGVDGMNGTPVWQVPLGHDVPFPPVTVPGNPPALIVFDSRDNELVKLNGRDGALNWRQPLGEPVESAPLVLGNQVFQATPTGNLLVLDLSNGSLQATLKLGLPLAATPVADDAGQFLYVVAQESVMFLIARDPLSCVGVEYVGHAAGAIACSPVRLGRYLVVVENHEIKKSRWNVYLLMDDGAKVRPIQKLEMTGWVWQTPAWSGSVIWSTTDRGAVAAYSVGSYDDKVPFKPIAELAAESDDKGPTFGYARNDHEIWRSSMRSSCFDVNAERGGITVVWSIQEAGAAVAPIQTADRLAVFTHEAGDKPGVALWGIDPQDGRVRWRTVLGIPWPLNPTPTADSPGLVTLGIEGKPARIDIAKLAKGGFLELPIPAAGTFRLPSGNLQRFQVGEMAIIVPSVHAQRILVQAAGETTYKPLDLPAPLSAQLLVWGSDLLVPCQDGRIYLIDPTTGASKAEPFVAPFDRNKPIHWLDPVALEGDAVALVDQTGVVRRLVKANDPQPRLAATNETKLGSPVATTPASTGSALVLATEDGRIRALAARDLSPLGAWNIDSRVTFGPVSAQKHVFISDANGKLHAFGPDGRRLWTVEQGGQSPAGAPVVRESVVWLLNRDGSLQARSLADGKPLSRFPLGVLPAGGLMALGDLVAVPVTPGSLRLLTKLQTKAPASQKEPTPAPGEPASGDAKSTPATSGAAAEPRR